MKQTILLNGKLILPTLKNVDRNIFMGKFDNIKLRAFGFLLFLMISVTSNLNAQKISPDLVGTNVWYINPGEQVWELTKDCGVKTIRIGGHAYDKNLPSNEMLLDWVRKIQAMGAEPVLQVSKYQPPNIAARLVRLFNIEKHEGIAPIKYWNIGNEPWLQANRPPQSTMGEMVENYFKPIAAAMKNVDSTILIYGPNECDYMDYYDDLFGGKNDITGKIPGHSYYYCDGLTWHRYPQGDGDPAVEGANDFLERIIKAKTKVDQVNAMHKRTGKDALQWGIGEYNSKGGPEVHTWGNGQMFGVVLGWCMEYEAKFATSWSMFEHGGDRKGSDFSFIDGENMTPRASYRHMQFVANYFTGNFLKGFSADTSFMIYGAQDGDRLSVMIMNRGFGEQQEYSLYLNDPNPAESGINLIVKANRDDVYKDVIQPRATQVLIFKGDTITKINYSSQDFENERPPYYSKIKSETMKIRTKPLNPINKRELPENKKYINLGAYYNFAINEEIHGKPDNIIPVPPGISDYNGVKFDVRGIIQLASRISFEKSHIRYPEKITGIAVNTSAQKLCFLHSSAWESAKGTKVAEIVVHYANNQSRSIQIKSREEVEDWWFHTENSIFPANAELAWEGSNDRIKNIGFVLKLYHFTWENPLPEIEITSIDLISSMNDTGYMLYGITCL
jgi:hypothetical protein